jgi:hypothetical protein
MFSLKCQAFAKLHGITAKKILLLIYVLFATGKSGDPERCPASILVRSPENRVINDGPRRRLSADFPGRQTSPSYCIRDMAALFENRRDGPSQTPPRPAPTGKQYLSSV